VKAEATAPAAAAPAPAQPASPAATWDAVRDLVRQKRPLVSGWLDVATLLEAHGGALKIGFPTSEQHARDSLMREATRKFLEDVVREVTGAAPRLDFVLDATLKTPELPEIRNLFQEEAPAPKAEPRRETPAEAQKPAASADFYNDPLIQAALETFKARILPAG
jgi:DNA polymerase-3 subunit gamma/tau